MSKQNYEKALAVINSDTKADCHELIHKLFIFAQITDEERNSLEEVLNKKEQEAK